jgi:heat shock protein HslJ
MMRIVALITATILIAACGSRPTEESLGTPRVSADGSLGTPTLMGTRWVLVGLGTTPVTAGTTAREPFMILTADAERRITGSGGCNSMFGRYTLDGDVLTFGDIGATKMACDRGMNVETSLFSALSRVARWRIAGRQLEVKDSTGAVLARFEARK